MHFTLQVVSFMLSVILERPTLHFRIDLKRSVRSELIVYYHYDVFNTQCCPLCYHHLNHYISLLKMVSFKFPTW